MGVGLFAKNTGEAIPYGRLLVVLVAAPFTLLLSLFVVSILVGVAFGDVLFLVTILWAVVWILTTGSRRASLGMAGTSRLGAWFGLDTEYARQISRGTLRQFRDPSVILAMLTVTIVVGWALVSLHWVIQQ